MKRYLLYIHIVGMDSFAKGLKAAHKLIEDRVLEDFIEKRYRSFREGIGLEITSGKADFHTLEAYALQNDSIRNESGRQEMLKGMVNRYIMRVD